MSLQWYATLGRAIGCQGKNDRELCIAFIGRLKDLCKKLNMPASFQDAGIDEKRFMSEVASIADESLDDQCSGANPRFPISSELEELLRSAYYESSIEI